VLCLGNQLDARRGAGGTTTRSLLLSWSLSSTHHHPDWIGSARLLRPKKAPAPAPKPKSPLSTAIENYKAEI
jgi:hypothetical protein